MMNYQNKSEQSILVPLRDGKMLHAILRGEINDHTPVVVMMHGRPGSANELLQYLGARFISERGFSTLRLSMYNFGAEYRSILDCTLKTHISDFEDVVQFLREKGVGQVFALGHSYGGITILGSKAVIDGAILWDPSHGLAWYDSNPDFISEDYPEKTFGNIVVGTGGHGYILSKEQEEYDMSLGDTSDWAKNKHYPMKFILAGAGPLATLAQKYYDVASEPKYVVEIKDAHHQFEDSDAVVEKLFTETVDGLKSLLR
jgi:pimeloyl-ACP methyl ester carboxylesterase